MNLTKLQLICSSDIFQAPITAFTNNENHDGEGRRNSPALNWKFENGPQFVDLHSTAKRFGIIIVLYAVCLKLYIYQKVV